jgi:hypothetical protein
MRRMFSKGGAAQQVEPKLKNPALCYPTELKVEDSINREAMHVGARAAVTETCVRHPRAKRRYA